MLGCAPYDPHKWRGMGVISTEYGFIQKNVAELVSMDTFLLLHFAPNWKTTHLKSPRGFEDRLQGLRGLGSRNPHCSDGFSAGSRDSNASSIFF
jgi:hypothetical protein